MNKHTKRMACFILCFVMMLALGISSYAVETRSDPDMCFADTGGGNLNGRSGPGTEYKIICKYPDGTQLFYSLLTGWDTDSEGVEWVEVRGKTTTGEKKTAWVSTEYVRFESPYRLRLLPIPMDTNEPDVG